VGARPLAGIIRWNFYFRLFSGAIKGPQIVKILGHLLGHVPGKLLVIWDRLAGHRSRLVKDFVAAQKNDWNWNGFLPGRRS
jgi:hypothetical protein